MTTHGSEAALVIFQRLNPDLIFDPQGFAAIIIKERTYKIHKSVLLADSAFFRILLNPNGPFIEGQTQTIDIGDFVTENDFAMYVDTMYRLFSVQNFKLRFTLKHGAAIFGRCLQLCKLSQFFFNKPMQAIADEALEYYAPIYSASNWEYRYKSTDFTDEALKWSVVGLQNLFLYCQRHEVPRQEKFVDAASKMPIQLFTKLHDQLDIDFRTAVMKKMLVRYENPGLERPALLMSEDQN